MAGPLSDVHLCGNRKGTVSKQMVLKKRRGVASQLSHLISSCYSLGVPLLLFRVNARNSCLFLFCVSCHAVECTYPQGLLFLWFWQMLPCPATSSRGMASHPSNLISSFCSLGIQLYYFRLMTGTLVFSCSACHVMLLNACTYRACCSCDFDRCCPVQRLHCWVLWGDRGRSPGHGVAHPRSAVQLCLLLSLQHAGGTVQGISSCLVSMLNW